VDVAFDYRPAQMVGGDYCDVWMLQDGRMAFVVADVAGKGLPAALVMANLHASLHAGAAFCTGPAPAVEYVNRYLAEHLPEGPIGRAGCDGGTVGASAERRGRDLPRRRAAGG